jgi:hypothetical protein
VGGCTLLGDLEYESLETQLAPSSTQSVTLGYICFVVDRNLYKIFVVGLQILLIATSSYKMCHFPTRPSRGTREADPPGSGLAPRLGTNLNEVAITMLGGYNVR